MEEMVDEESKIWKSQPEELSIVWTNTKNK